ncbi:putative Transcriptional regulator, AlpA family [Tenacibaculum sp. 190130A14a]|uniref:helix-turn-helix domain-containing protein n=1 Tax=Tenacibaculum polynesiense TaxID=3137857 RepID=UPI00320101EB
MTEKLKWNFHSPKIQPEARLLFEIEKLKNEVKVLSELTKKQKMENELITQEEACKILNRSSTTLWRYRNKGILPYLRLAGIGLRYKKSDVMNLLKNNNNND